MNDYIMGEKLPSPPQFSQGLWIHRRFGIHHPEDNPVALAALGNEFTCLHQLSPLPR